MTKEEIGNSLAAIRRSSTVNIQLSGYAIESIEKNRSSYPVSNLIKLCNALCVQLVIVDENTGEKYPIDSILDCHMTIRWLMERYEIDEADIYRNTGTHYTVPNGNRQPLSINTLFDVCATLKCNLDLVIRK